MGIVIPFPVHRRKVVTDYEQGICPTCELVLGMARLNNAEVESWVCKDCGHGMDEEDEDEDY